MRRRGSSSRRQPSGVSSSICASGPTCRISISWSLPAFAGTASPAGIRRRPRRRAFALSKDEAREIVYGMALRGVEGEVPDGSRSASHASAQASLLGGSRLRALDKRDKRGSRLAAANPRDLSLRHDRITKNPGVLKVQLQTSAKDQLRTIVARIERLEEEKAALAADLREVYAEAKGNGFDVKALRAVIRMRKQDENKTARGRGRARRPICTRSAWRRPRPLRPL